jgi:hypothetical protein
VARAGLKRATKSEDLNGRVAEGFAQIPKEQGMEMIENAAKAARQ